MITIESIQAYYEVCGGSVDAVSHLLKYAEHKGFDCSFDESLYVFYFDGFSVVVGNGGSESISLVADHQGHV